MQSMSKISIKYLQCTRIQYCTVYIQDHAKTSTSTAENREQKTEALQYMQIIYYNILKDYAYKNEHLKKRGDAPAPGQPDKTQQTRPETFFFRRWWRNLTSRVTCTIV